MKLNAVLVRSEHSANIGASARAAAACSSRLAATSAMSARASATRAWVSERLRAAGYRPVRGELRDGALLACAARHADGVVHAAHTQAGDAADADPASGLTRIGKA